MSAKPTYETQRIDHLGIVTGICQEISLVETIDAQVKSSNRKVSCVQGAKAMILNALGFVGRALYQLPDYLHNKPVDLLIDPGLTADDFNDDILGRCLDDLYAAGVTGVFYQVAAHALQVYGIRSRFVHSTLVSGLLPGGPELGTKTLEKAQAKELEKPRKNGADKQGSASTARRMLWSSSTGSGNIIRRRPKR